MLRFKIQDSIRRAEIEASASVKFPDVIKFISDGNGGFILGRENLVNTDFDHIDFTIGLTSEWIDTDVWSDNFKWL